VYNLAEIEKPACLWEFRTLYVLAYKLLSIVFGGLHWVGPLRQRVEALVDIYLPTRDETREKLLGKKYEFDEDRAFQNEKHRWVQEKWARSLVLSLFSRFSCSLVPYSSYIWSQAF